MAEHPIQGIMNVTMDKIHEMVDANTIIGKAITTEDGTTILPAAPTLTARMPPTRTCSAAAPARASTSSRWHFW